MQRRPVVVAVDDEPLNLSVYRRLLRKELELVGVADSAGALEVLASGPVDLVITDNRLRDERGTDLARTIKARWPRIPILMITGFVCADVERLATDGIARVVAKPIGGDELVRLCRDMLAS